MAEKINITFPDGKSHEERRGINGFEIAEIDLRLRGPGQVLGTQQSGLPDFALANLIDDEGILESARKEAFDSLWGN